MLDMSQFVDKYFEMDPKTDDMIRKGTLLMEGMTVLLESSEWRIRLVQEGQPVVLREGYAETEQARRWNRWVTVEDLGWGGPDICSFVGVYSDGTKKLIQVPENCAWYVKKSSIPDPEALALEEEAQAKADLQERGIPVDGVNISVEPVRVYSSPAARQVMDQYGK